MCTNYSIVCKCGKHDVSFMFKNDLIPPEVVEAVYCPDCSGGVSPDSRSMLKDNNWLIKYDMEVAHLYDNKLPDSDARDLSPEILFDKGYATWRGIYPGDHIDNVREREELVKMVKIDPKKYFQEIKSWAVNRMARLKEEGWRKAYDG